MYPWQPCSPYVFSFGLDLRLEPLDSLAVRPLPPTPFEEGASSQGMHALISVGRGSFVERLYVVSSPPSCSELPPPETPKPGSVEPRERTRALPHQPVWSACSAAISRSRDREDKLERNHEQPSGPPLDPERAAPHGRRVRRGPVRPVRDDDTPVQGREDDHRPPAVGKVPNRARHAARRAPRRLDEDGRVRPGQQQRLVPRGGGTPRPAVEGPQDEGDGRHDRDLPGGQRDVREGRDGAGRGQGLPADRGGEQALLLDKNDADDDENTANINLYATDYAEASR
ncbi:hypothetical protein THAOC_17506, partial [Thalassiosira oceanica]